jgi:hypothetical protein
MRSAECLPLGLRKDGSDGRDGNDREELSVVASGAEPVPTHLPCPFRPFGPFRPWLPERKVHPHSEFE